jgi:ubiquitin carboxyl-terminal hydrolase 25
MSSKYISSSCCERCLHHFDVIVDYTKGSSRGEPCGPGTNFPIHHFQHYQSKRREITGKETGQDKYDACGEIHYFGCSAPNCPAILQIRISPPRLNKDQLAGLWDPTKVLKRGQRALEEQAGRFQNEFPLSPVEVLNILRTYLLDALNLPATETKRIAVRNKKFQLAFSDECDDMFEYLDFESRMDPSSSGVGVYLISDNVLYISIVLIF